MSRGKKKGNKWWIVVAMLIVMTVVFSVGYDWWLTRKSRFVRYPAFGIPIPENYLIHGIDVSKYQQTISWDAVKEMKVKNIALVFFCWF